MGLTGARCHLNMSEIHRKEIEEQIRFLEKSIEGMLTLGGKLVPFNLNKAKNYNERIKKLFVEFISKGYLKIEAKDLNSICKESLDKWDKIDYFINKNRKSSRLSTFQQVFYSIKPQKTALILGCSLYLMIFENLFAQFDNEVIIRIFADLENKKGISNGNYISVHSKIEILRRLDKSNTKFLDETCRELRNSIGHFDFLIHNGRLFYGGTSITKKELREKTEKILWLSHMVLLNKDLAIREYLLKTIQIEN